MIKICFVKEFDPDIQSSITARKMGTKYSHVLVLFNDHQNLFKSCDTGKRIIDLNFAGEKIFHSTGEGVHIENPNEYFKTHEIVKQFELPLVRHEGYLFGFIKGCIGKDYGFDQIAAIALDKESNNQDERMICSEVAGLVIRDECGILEMDGFGDQDKWKPIDNDLAIEKHLKI